MLSTMVLVSTDVVKARAEDRVDAGTQTGHYLHVATLKDRLRLVLDKTFAGNSSAWSRRAGLTRVHLGKLMTRETADSGAVELRVIDKLADAAQVSPGWLAYGVGDPGDVEWAKLPDPLVSTILHMISETPGLKDWVQFNSGSITAAELVQGVTFFRAHPTLARADGQPKEGWSKVFEDAARRTPSRLEGANAVESLEREQWEPPPPPTRSGIRSSHKSLAKTSLRGGIDEGRVALRKK